MSGKSPLLSLIAPVLQEAPCAPRYKEGVAGDTQPVRPGGRWGGGVPSWRKSVSEAPIAASVTSVSRMRRERRASRRRSRAGSVYRFREQGIFPAFFLHETQTCASDPKEWVIGYVDVTNTTIMKHFMPELRDFYETSYDCAKNILTGIAPDGYTYYIYSGSPPLQIFMLLFAV